MAAFHYDDYRASDEGGTLAAVLNWGGAILSLILIAGLATWGWKLWVRDVTGIPVVRALEGPMRIAPEEPGGLASEYQGLTVNRIAEERVEAPPSEQVVLAPQPATLNEEEDLAMAELPAVAPEPHPEIEAVEVVPRAEIGTPESFALADGETIDESIAADALRDQTLAVAPATEPTPSATDLAVAAALSETDLRPEPAVLKVDGEVQAPVTTPRPVIRPTNLQTVALETSGTAASETLAAVAGEVDTASIAPGTRLVQLGAFGTADIAREEWAGVEARFGDYFTGKSRVIQEVESGGREFYRLRVMGFDDLADARRFCAVIVAEGTNCIPVVHQ